MKLFYASASPFVRKVMVVATELGLDGRIERIDAATTPMKADPKLAEANPVAKLPTLVTDAGEALYDSGVICEYLATEASSASMLPANGSARWVTLRRQALADGLLDAAVLRRYEKAMRPEEKQSADWDEGQRLKVTRALDALEGETGALGSAVNLGTIAIACALGYLDFRFAHEDWRTGRPKLAAWYEDNWAKRPSMTATAPGS
jgi:glutathione S-transferase